MTAVLKAAGIELWHVTDAAGVMRVTVPISLRVRRRDPGSEGMDAKAPVHRWTGECGAAWSMLALAQQPGRMAGPKAEVFYRE